MGSPFKNWPNRPLPDECAAVAAALATLHGTPQPSAEGCSNTEWNVLDHLIRTILSQNTTDKTSIKAFNSLRQQFPTYEAVLAAPDADVEESIRMGGLAAIKTGRIKTILQSLQDSTGKICLEHLRQQTNDEIKDYLTQFSGVGPKTVSCVLMFALQRYEFPVDTHVWRITKQLGWVPKNASREDAYLHLNNTIPDELKYALHVQLVQHGKICAGCASVGSKGSKKVAAGECPIKSFKKGGGGGGIKVEESGNDDDDVKIRLEMDGEAGVDVKKEEGEGVPKKKRIKKE